MHGSKADRHAVPGIDRRDRKRQLHELVLGEMLPDLIIHSIGRMGLRDEGNGLGPGERRPLAFRVKRRVAPCIEQVKALLALAAGARRAYAGECNRRKN